MNLPKRLRNIAKTQINNIKERLDRIDIEAEEEAIQRRYERDARAELDDVTDIRLPMRTPEEIAGGKVSPSPRAQERPIGSNSGIRPDNAPAAIAGHPACLSHRYGGSCAPARGSWELRTRRGSRRPGPRSSARSR